MSYWILLPQSGIPVLATTLQRLTNSERCTDETKYRMRQYDEKLAAVFETQSADMARGLRHVDARKIIDPDNEDPEFFSEFTRVIDNASLPHADDITNVKVTSDQYVGMELALLRGSEGEALHARVRSAFATRKAIQSELQAKIHCSTLEDMRSNTSTGMLRN